MITTAPWLCTAKKRGEEEEDKRSELEHFHRGGEEKGPRPRGELKEEGGWVRSRFLKAFNDILPEWKERRQRIRMVAMKLDSACSRFLFLSFSLSFASISSTRRSHSGAFIRPPFPSSSRGSTNALHGWRERKLLHFRWGKNRVAISIRSPIVAQSRESNGRDGTTADALFPLPSPTPERTDGRANVEIYARAFAE